LNLRELGIARKAGDEILSPLQLAEQIDKEQAEQEAQEAEKRAEKPQDERSPASEGQRLCSYHPFRNLEGRSNPSGRS